MGKHKYTHSRLKKFYKTLNQKMMNLKKERVNINIPEEISKDSTIIFGQETQKQKKDSRRRYPPKNKN
ncbi:34274_t:CDS:1, partial [Racocetra persica]